MNAKPTMGFVEAIKTCYAKYFNFNGRARRSEFWWFYLFASIFSSIPVYIVRMMHTAAAAEFRCLFRSAQQRYARGSGC